MIAILTPLLKDPLTLQPQQNASNKKHKEILLLPLCFSGTTILAIKQSKPCLPLRQLLPSSVIENSLMAECN